MLCRRQLFFRIIVLFSTAFFLDVSARNGTSEFPEASDEFSAPRIPSIERAFAPSANISIVVLDTPRRPESDSFLAFKNKVSLGSFRSLKHIHDCDSPETYLVHTSKSKAADWFDLVRKSAEAVSADAKNSASTESERVKSKRLLTMLSTSVITTETASWWRPYGSGVNVLLDPHFCTHYVGAADMDILTSGVGNKARYAPKEKTRADFLAGLLYRRGVTGEDILEDAEKRGTMARKNFARGSSSLIRVLSVRRASSHLGRSSLFEE